eukprot:6949122-Alexandrium_andersonii.AAC.1
MLGRGADRRARRRAGVVARAAGTGSRHWRRRRRNAKETSRRPAGQAGRRSRSRSTPEPWPP